ncbi:MAG: gamma-glutamylcyclotransferase family protein [Aestuariivirga sp.]
MPLHYFAYGSNMSLAQMRARCPESVAIGIGWLAEHALVFPRYSTRRQSGAASIAPRRGSTVWGVIYSTTETDLARLDVFEGYRADRPEAENNYNRAMVSVARENMDALACVTYIARPEAEHVPPSLDYLQTILTGAIENALPEAYVQALRQVKPAGS